VTRCLDFEVIQQNGLMLCRRGDAAASDPFPALGLQNHIDRRDLRYLIEHLSRFIAQAGVLGA
jgi:hypothetical protein